MRAVTSTRPARVPSSRSCSGDLGSSKSSPLSVLRVIPSAWHSRPGPLVNSRAATPGARPRFRAICSSPRHRLQRAYQHASATALALAGDIHAGVHPINEINVSVPRRPEQHLIPRRGAAMRMRRRISRFPVRSQIGLHFDDASGNELPRWVSFGQESCPAVAAPRAPAAPQRKPASTASRAVRCSPPPHAAHSTGRVDSPKRSAGSRPAVERASTPAHVPGSLRNHEFRVLARLILTPTNPADVLSC